MKLLHVCVKKLICVSMVMVFLYVTSVPLTVLAATDQNAEPTEQEGAEPEKNSDEGVENDEAEEKTENQVAEEAAEEIIFYPDVSLNHWVYPDLVKLVEAEVTVKPLDQYFAPNKSITRADLVRLILRAKGIDSPELLPFSKPRFKDITKDMPTYYYIEAAYSMAITNGKSDRTFVPHGPSTREETIALIIRAMGLEQRAKEFNKTQQVLGKFQDANTISPNFKPIVAFAIEHGMIQGKTTETNHMVIDPKDFTTRSEAAAMIARFILPETEQLQTIEVDAHTIQYHSILTVEATAYSNQQPNLSDYTSLGLFVRYGIVAVDPKVIPYGTHLYIEGYGFAVAGDTGGAIKGNKIDVAFPTVAEALQYGRKKNVKVYILDNKISF